MKTSSLLRVMLLSMVMHVSTSVADQAISVDLFFEHLHPHGNWFETDDYGYVWQPRDIGGEWTPYRDGRWVYTDVGWTWLSGEPYGWAVYHYGRWANVRDVGWVWVPGTEWGPGWVSWRRSPDHVGWAPLPPEAELGNRTGFGSWVDRYYDIGPAHYQFIEIGNLGAPRLKSVFVDRSQNLILVNQTTNVTNITFRDHFVFNGGPDYDETVSASRDPIPRYRLERRRDVALDGKIDERQLIPSIHGDTLTVTDLPLRGSPQGPPPKIARKIEKAELDRGWRGTGSPEEFAAIRKKIQDEVALPEGLPDQTVRTGRKMGDAGDDPRSIPSLDRVESPESDGPGEGRMKGDSTEVPVLAPGIPSTPVDDGRMKGKAVKLPPEPRVTTLPGDPGSSAKEGKGQAVSPSVERPIPPAEERRESKGTKKDPAAPGTQVEPVPSVPGSAASPRPSAPGQEQRREEGGLPDLSSPPREPSDQNPGGIRRAPPAPGGSATPPLPSQGAPSSSSPDGREEDPDSPAG